MFVSMVEIQPRPGKQDRVVELFNEMTERMQQVAGLAGSQLLQPLADGRPLVVITAWKDQAACEAHHRTSHERQDKVPELAELHKLCLPDLSARHFKQVHLVHGTGDS